MTVLAVLVIVAFFIIYGGLILFVEPNGCGVLAMVRDVAIAVTVMLAVILTLAAIAWAGLHLYRRVA